MWVKKTQLVLVLNLIGWAGGWCDFSRPTTERSKAKPNKSNSTLNWKLLCKIRWRRWYQPNFSTEWARFLRLTTTLGNLELLKKENSAPHHPPPPLSCPYKPYTLVVFVRRRFSFSKIVKWWMEILNVLWIFHLNQLLPHAFLGIQTCPVL